MHIKRVWIKNFRALEDIHLDLTSPVSVIVGPNAAGKTTIIEAIRLIKALLTPRTQNEANQVLFALGASSPHVPLRFRVQAVARDVGKDVVAGCSFILTEAELQDIQNNLEQITVSIVQSQIGQPFANTDALIGFLSSPQGIAMSGAAKQAVETALENIKINKECTLEIKIGPTDGPRAVSDAMHAQFIGFLERRLPPYSTIFTYFPADRALPFGEQPVQLGSPDANAQLESYNSQPQTKFNRLKNLIFSGVIFSPDGKATIDDEFDKIFSGILKGRKLQGFEVNDIGFLNVLIRDLDTQRIFDLDGMSSGEKGLLLTFLIISRSVQTGGIVLLDEPELHLNPAVCKDLLPFLVENYVKSKDLQIIICSHSAEIVATALESENCSLYHLMSPNNISKIQPKDDENVEEVFRRLGASQTDKLLYKGIIFVEGPHDVAILEAGFGLKLRRFKLKYADGKNSIIKAINSLQESEKASPPESPTYFIIDRDEKALGIKSTPGVKVLEWDRRCLENYFIDLDAISKVLMDSDFVKNPLPNQGEVSKLLKDLAFSQLTGMAAKKVYEKSNFENLGSRKNDFVDKDVPEISNALFARISSLKNQLDALDIAEWENNFNAETLAEKTKLEDAWLTTWPVDCDGKRLISDLSKKVTFNMNPKQFKVRLIKEMALQNSDCWKSIDMQLSNLLK